MTSDEMVIRDRLDLEMLERPHLWPGDVGGAPALFVKRNVTSLGAGQTGRCALIEGDYVLVVCDWTLGGAPRTFRYPTAKAVVADGWEVD